jgi:ubiquinol-cytochrome c reductase cytochrome b subunit
MKSWTDWLDERLDYRLIGNRMKNRLLPKGPSWLNTSASCLFWLLIIQCVTGLLLMASYSPSMASAWASVNFIDQTAAGRFIRGVHHYASHAMILLLGLHLLRVMSAGAYRAPRELIWITGLMLLPLMVVWTVTGNPLAATQKGISQIQVEGNILGSTPVLGSLLRRILFGGDEVGTLTLTRLYFLHVGLMPLAAGGLCLVHLYQIVKHSQFRSAPVEGQQPDAKLPYWPYQTVRNMSVLTVLVGILSYLAWQDGAPLYAPADPDIVFSPRPEWYFRWLFELRRHFTGDTEFIATMVIPAGFLGAFMAAPFFDRFRSSRVSVVCRLFVATACLSGWSYLTLMSYQQDWNDPEYLKEQAAFEALSARALELARTEPLTEKGAIQLLRQDPHTQGPKLFAQHCISCHSHTDSEGQGLKSPDPSAPNLYGIGTSDWIAGFLDPQRIVSDAYFGRTKFRDGEMVQHMTGMFVKTSSDSATDTPAVQTALAAALAAEAEFESRDSELAAKGRALITSSGSCTDCHRFHEHGELGSAPDLTGYASPKWVRQMIANPTGPQHYRDANDRMPDFAADVEHPELNLLTTQDLDLLVRWLRSPSAAVRQVK